MTIRKVSFCGRKEAEALVGHPRLLVVSITDTDRRPASAPRRAAGAIFIPVGNDRPFDADAAGNLWAYLEEAQSSVMEYELLIHCEYGRTRSAGVAEFVRQWLGLDHGGDATDADLFIQKLLCERAGLAFRVRKGPVRPYAGDPLAEVLP